MPSTSAVARPDLPPSGIIDPHIHQWDPLTTRRAKSGTARLLRFLPTIPRALRWTVPQADREFVGNPAHVLRPYLPADYRRDAAELPVLAVVHIEAAWPARKPMDTVAETRWLTTLPFGRDSNPGLGAIIAHVDPRWPDVAAVLDGHLEASPLVRGIRLSATHHPDPGVRDFADAPNVLSSRAFLNGFAAVAARDLSMEIWCYDHQLTDTLTLVTEYPETTFVLNHYATPVGAFGPRGRGVGRTAYERTAQLDAWRENVAALAEHPNVVAKHSGLGMPVLGGERRRPLTAASVGELVDRAAPLIRHLHDCFGSDRTMWASNYPIDKPGLTLGATLQIVTQVLGSDAKTTKLLHDVARATYRIAAPNQGA